jgi:hypothetical protein
MSAWSSTPPKKTRSLARASVMELAGVEAATSWVPSRRPAVLRRLAAVATLTRADGCIYDA